MLTARCVSTTTIIIALNGFRVTIAVHKDLAFDSETKEYLNVLVAFDVFSSKSHETQPPFITKRNFRHSCVSSKVTDYLPPGSPGYHRNSRRKPHFFFACKTSLLALHTRVERRGKREREIGLLLCTRGEFRGCCAYGCIRILPHFLWDSSRPISIKREREERIEKRSATIDEEPQKFPPLPSLYHGFETRIFADTSQRYRLHRPASLSRED